MSRGESERNQKEARPKLAWRGERGKSYLNDIVAGVHARRLALIAPLERPCYPCSRVGRGRQTLPPRRFRTCVRRHVNAQVPLFLPLSLSLFLTPSACRRERQRGRVSVRRPLCLEEIRRPRRTKRSSGLEEDRDKGKRGEHSRCTRKYSLARESACPSTREGRRGRAIASETLSRLKKGRER